MATLKIGDLSVGDWVHHDFYEVDMRVVNIYGNRESVIAARRSDRGITCHLDHFTPIPITAEILVANGFMRCSVEFNIYEYTTLLGKMLRTTQVHLDAPQSINAFLHDTTIERGFYHREKTSVHILRDELYVHDLQHALRLAGLDKEINL